jgi:glycosyltransferase involved in cell wall biosynthesis
MKITQINTHDLAGGAARVAYSLNKSLNLGGIQSRLFVADKKSKDPNVSRFSTGNLFCLVDNKLKLGQILYPTYQSLFNKLFVRESSIVHFHNLHGGYFNILSLPSICNSKPCVWTLHDPWIIYKESLIPEYKNVLPRNPFFFNCLLRNVVNDAKIVMVAPSKWLLHLVKVCYPNKKVRLIYHGIDTKTFVRRDKMMSRKKLGLPLGKKIILFLANGGSENKKKGWDYVKDIINNFSSNKKLLFLCIGGLPKKHQRLESVKYVDYIKDQRLLSNYYSAADLFVFTSVAENFPLVILEAMSCGLPILSFNVGGVHEMVAHGENGYVAKYMNKSDLFRGFGKLLNLGRDEVKEMGGRNSLKVGRFFSLEKMTKSYIELYNSLL